MSEGPLFTLEKIDEIRRRAVAEKWPFAYLFNSLKATGVERYEVNVLSHEIRYVGGGASLVAPPPAGFTPLSVGPRYDLPALQTALARVQAGEATYEQFLTEIAAAGISFYRVDMVPRTVTYHGAGKRDKLVENVPETTAS